MCIIVVYVYDRAVFSESLLGFGVSSGEFRENVVWKFSSAVRTLLLPDRVPAHRQEVQEHYLLYVIVCDVLLVCIVLLTCLLLLLCVEVQEHSASETVPRNVSGRSPSCVARPLARERRVTLAAAPPQRTARPL